METKLRPHGDQPETKCKLLRGKSEEKYDDVETTWTQDGDKKSTKWRQNRTQNGDKMDTKWTQNGDKMETKWRQNGHATCT